MYKQYESNSNVWLYKMHIHVAPPLPKVQLKSNMAIIYQVECTH